MTKKPKEIERPYVICECGYEVSGTSEKHAISNLKNHKKSKIHKKMMKRLEKKE